ncbi:MAG: protein kinase domain-containing protein [Acidimicrobiales bacterium]
MAAHTRDIGRFKNATLIGRGGFGAVYQASDAEHGREVAIKVLQGTLGDTERRRFDRERQTMGRLGSHPNIVPVHESGYTDQGEGYIVMSLATKGSVADRLERDGTLPWNDAVSIIIAIARAAQAAHDQGVLHRDIKPDNILVDAYDNPRLTDFGIAAVASNATATTSTTATIAHAAPEVLHGLPPTAAIDIYALGSTLYNLILGRPPFQEPDDHGVPAMITRALSQPPPDLRLYGVPDTVAAIAERALAKEANARQATAAQLADELDAALLATSTGNVPPPGGSAAPPTTIAGGAQPPSTPNPAAGAAAAAAVAAAPLGAVPPSTAPPSTAPPGTHPPATVPPSTVRPGTVPPAAMPPGGQGGFNADQTMVNPVPGPSPAGYGAGAGGASPPFESSTYPNGAGGGKSKLPFLLVGAVVAVIVAIGAVLALSGGDDDQPEGTANAGTGQTSTADETTSTSSGTTQSTDTTAGEATTASTTPTTASTAPTTASTTTTTSTTSTTVQDRDCPVPVVDTRTARFLVKICDNGRGSLAYVGQNRSTGDGITLPACHAGNLVFIATNEGFQYVVDVDQEFLVVNDPSGDQVVFEPFVPPIVVDDAVPLDPC